MASPAFDTRSRGRVSTAALAVEFHGGRAAVSARAVDGVNLDIHQHETVGLVGESGSGKTTLGRAILGLYRPTAGQILFRGQNVIDPSPGTRQLLHRSLQMVFQNPYSSLNPRMTVAQTIGEALRFHRIVPERGIPAEIERLLGLVGLAPETATRTPRALSGGQCQRVGLARAMVCVQRCWCSTRPWPHSMSRAQVLNRSWTCGRILV
jgi:ABC-type glutathione transport system ATPase component